MKFTFLILLFVLLPNIMNSSELMTIRGSITDSATSQPLKFVTIRAIGIESKATVTSKQGAYVLRLKKGEFTITYSMVGYGSVSKNITIGSKDITLDIRLSQSAFRSAEVIVSAEDPGVKLMRSVIAKKQKWRDSLQRYTYMLYTKFVVSADTLTAGRSSGRSGSGKMGWWGGTMHKWDKEAKWSIGGAARAAAAADADYPEIEAGHVNLLRH